ncbi:serine/threonine protein kinase [Kitasatospora sp. NPDC094028]
MIGAGTVLNVRYRLIERLGRGGMGEVWRAHDSVLAREVAVKILNAELFENAAAIESFRREAQLVAAIDHPGVVKVHDYGESGDGSGDGTGDGTGEGGGGGGSGEGGGGGTGDRCAYIVMDLIDGRPLNQVLEADGRMPPERALGMVAAALDALHAAHQRSIVHRDVKPSNLMVRRSDDAVVVTDFGIALAIAGTKATKRSGVIGTAAYMSPEQAVNGRIGPASDLYSIGVVCYELLVGTLPFVGDGPVQVAIKHVHEPVPELPRTVPAAVRELVARALSKAPEDRYASAAEMAAAARAAVGLPPGAVSATGTVDLRGKAGAGAPGPAAAAPDPAGGPRPVVKAEPVVKVDPSRPTEPVGRRSRRTLLVPVIIPAVISVGTATALLIDRSPGSSDAAAPPGTQPTAAATAPATPGGAAPGAATAATTAPTGTPSATQPGQQPGTPDKGQPQPQPQQPGTAPGAGGNGGGSGSGGQGGGAAGGTTAHQPAPAPANPANPGNPANPANPNPQPPPQNSSGGPSSGGSSAGGSSPAGGNPPPAQSPARPANCGGDSWVRIVSVSTGTAIGMANDSLASGTKIVLGGASQYGWSITTGTWNEYHACNSGGPILAYDFGADSVSLGDYYSSFTYRWTVQSTGSGTYTLGDLNNSRCMTAIGVGQQVAMQSCTPGLAAQQWRIQP